MQNNDLFLRTLSDFHIADFFKIVILVVLAVYILFSLVVTIQVKQLNKLVNIHAKYASSIILMVAVYYLFLSIALFIAAFSLL